MAEFKVVKKPDFKAKGKAISEEIKRTLEREGQFIRGEIIRRTQSGKTPEGGAFIDYSKEYRELLIREGESTNVDLTRTQQMLAAIQATVRRVSGGLELRLFFASTKEAAKARYNSATRPFFKLSKEQYRKLKNTINEAIKKNK